MTGMKYVIFEDNSFVIIPSIINHCDVEIGYKKPISAGFLYIKNVDGDENEIKVSCFGESISLDLKSREIDEEIIEIGYNVSCNSF